MVHLLSFALKKEAARFFETFVPVSQAKRLRTIEDNTRHVLNL
jgi:hypothetical protein